VLAKSLHLDLQLLHPQAFVYWQAMGSAGWALWEADLNSGKIFAPYPKYYVFAQYTRHIRPGMKILRGLNPNTVAAYDEQANWLVLVTLNVGSARWLSFNLTALGAALGDHGHVHHWETRFNGAKKYVLQPDLLMRQASFGTWFEQGSVQTFEIDGVAL
jgi:galactan endo-1,6-beta-galactosidase